MHLRRSLLTITLASLAALPVVLVTAAPANAKHKTPPAPVCPMLSDATGDSRTFGLPAYSPTVDIVSADIASGPTNVHVQLRLASIEDDLAADMAPRWDVAWSINNTDYMVQLRQVLVFGTYVGEFYVEQVSAGPVAFTVDLATDTITWTIPRTLLPDLATPGGTFTQVKSVTWTLPSAGRSADSATTTETYVDQTVGCISAS